MTQAHNRQINTGFNPKAQKITIEALSNTKYNGKDLAAGETVEVSRSEAKRLVTMKRELFKIHMV